MTNKKAIEWLKLELEKGVSWDDTSESTKNIREQAEVEIKEAFDMAIKALEQQEKTGWIPVTERLPDKDGEYLVTKKLRYFGNTEIDMACWFKNLMTDGNNGFYKSEQVIAWMPLPEAYKTQESEDTDG